MQYYEAIILGLLEGAAEFLPISSTGHLILASYALGIPDSAFLTSFIIAIQCGAIAAVLVCYWRSFLDVEILKRLVVAFIPTAVVGFTLYPLIKGVLLGNEMVVVAALGIGGVVLILFERWYSSRTKQIDDAPETISYTHAAIIGVFQSIAVIPGVSRSAATIIGGLLLGLSRVTIVEFSFLLAVPTLGAATAYDLLKSYQSFPTADISILLVGAITAFFAALVSLKLLLRFVQRYSFTAFGVYRIIIAALFFLVIL